MPPASDPASLPDTEQETLLLMSHGFTVYDIAEWQAVSPYTVKTRIKILYRKLSARDRGHAVRVGFERGLLAKCTRECDVCKNPPIPRGYRDV